jgi:hypothetical protein
VIGFCTVAGEVTVLLSFRYWPWVVSVVQPIVPLASRTQSVRETTV